VNVCRFVLFFFRIDFVVPSSASLACYAKGYVCDLYIRT
jgi:hypothetical protein